MLDLLHATETIDNHTIRVWTGVATDEGVGLIAMAEVIDERGMPVCRFEEFLADAVRHAAPAWPSTQPEAASALQTRAIERARAAVVSQELSALHGHRYDISA